MKIKTFLSFLLLLIFTLNLTNCRTPKVGTTPASVEEAEKILANEAKKKAKIAKKKKKKAYKRYWKLQSKEAKRSIKRNRKRQKKIARKKKH